MPPPPIAQPFVGGHGGEKAPPIAQPFVGGRGGEKAPPPPHSRDLRTVHGDFRTSIAVAVLAHMAGPAGDAVESALRGCQRRWDQLAPRNAKREDKVTWPEGLEAKRNAWDKLFQRFRAGEASLEELEAQVKIVNAARRAGVSFEKVPGVLDVVGPAGALLQHPAIAAALAGMRSAAQTPPEKSAEELELERLESEAEEAALRRDALRRKVGALPPSAQRDFQAVRAGVPPPPPAPMEDSLK